MILFNNQNNIHSYKVSSIFFQHGLPWTYVFFFVINLSVFVRLLVFVTTITILVGVDTPTHTPLMWTESPGWVSITTIPRKWFILKGKTGWQGQTKNKFGSLVSRAAAWNVTSDHFVSIVSDPAIPPLFTGNVGAALPRRAAQRCQHYTLSQTE